MSFDTLTMIGILAAFLCGGFLAALVARNDTGARRMREATGERAAVRADSGS